MGAVGVDVPLAHRTDEYAEDLGLRGYDAVHLATALDLAIDLCCGPSEPDQV
jgi:hypothetical protein